MANHLASIDDVSGKEFDFVIIGGGTAGCVLAGRLSEDPHISVAVLEAGPAHMNDPIIMDSASFAKPLWDPEYDWQYLTVPQPGVSGEPAMFPRGKGLGGTSQINWMIWNLPQREEIEGIRELGNEGWDWEHFHKYQKKVQRFCAPDSNERSEFKSLYKSDAVGHDGAVPISFARDECGADAYWQQSLAKYGIDIISTSLDGNSLGAFKGVNNIDPQTRNRAYAVPTYLEPALSRANLTVLTEAYVHKIITSRGDSGLAATGVQFEHDGNTHVVSARKEVIVSAGTIKSPQVLELSGIGDRKILESLGVEVTLELPSVGTNMQEHYSMGYTRWKIKDDQTVITGGMLEKEDFAKEVQRSLGLPDPIKMVPNGLSFISLQSASDRAAEIVQKQNDKFASMQHTYPPGLRESHQVQLKLLEDPRIPDLEIMLFPFMLSFFPTPQLDKPYITIFPMLTRAFSRGSVHILSADPKQTPAINPRYHDEDIDLDIMVEGLKFIRRVVQTEPFSKLVEEEILPGLQVSTEEQIYDYVRAHTTSSWHTAGTNSMLPRDKGGVVDNRFKVYGTQNIRVVDLSILPLHTAAHPQSVVYTLAEMAADITKSDWSGKN